MVGGHVRVLLVRPPRRPVVKLKVKMTPRHFCLSDNDAFKPRATYSAVSIVKIAIDRLVRYYATFYVRRVRRDQLIKTDGRGEPA